MEAQLTLNRRRRRAASLFGTRDKVLEGLRAAAVTIWNGEEEGLPASTKDYREAINQVEPLQRKGALRRLYPPPNKILQHFEKLTDAWAVLGFNVQARPHVTAPEIEGQIKKFYERPRLSNRPRGSQPRIAPAGKIDRERDPATGRMKSGGGVTVARLSDLPTEGYCLACKRTKPIAEMIVVHHRRQRNYSTRPRCKECYNKRERGHRREWKREYQRKWRADNQAETRSYWKDAPDHKQKSNRVAIRRFREFHHEILIQGRLRRQLGLKVSIAEAKQLLKRFGPCYPSRFGLTPEGIRAAERLRATMRRKGKTYKPAELRVVVYEQGLFIEPDKQTPPYQHASRTLSNWQRKRRDAVTAKAA
jgi:hypothetical protein